MVRFVRSSACAVLFVFVGAVSSCACKPIEPLPPAQVTVDAGSCTCAPPPAGPPTTRTPPREPTASHHDHDEHVTPMAVCQAKGKLPLEAAREYFDHQQFDQALSCSAQAAALAPNDALAHSERGNALAGLARFPEAQLAYARALAIDPDSLEALAGAAHLYAIDLPNSRENDELGSLYAERGFDLAQSQHDKEFSLYFARLSAMAFNDVGQPSDALERADFVLASHKDDVEALYERALALFELCRFDEAKPAFEALTKDKERSAFAHHHLGLIFERKGFAQQAGEHFAKANSLDADAFPPPVILSAQEFRAELDKALQALPDDMKRDLKGVPVAMEDLPDLEDLTANDPPLSPTILGLFRGPSLTEACEPEPDAKPGDPCRSIVVYRNNLGRAVKTREELIEQIRVTLLHEIGHLRGEDDGELAARGLE